MEGINGNNNSPNRVILKLDVRTKLLAVLLISQVMISGNKTDEYAVLRMVAVGLTFLLVFMSGYFKSAIGFAVFYVVIYYISLYIHFKSTIGIMLTVILTGFFLQFLPGIYLLGNTLRSTSVREYIAAMMKMHVPDAIVIPISVMFRFIPAIIEEYHSIKKAMYMRNISFSFNPIRSLEYRIVPLLMSMLNIGNELTVVAVARGFGEEGKRTNTCNVKLRIYDYLIMILLIVIFIVGIIM